MKHIIVFFLLLNFAAHAQQKMIWPGHKEAVIVLTYDDGIKSQLENAIPQLDAARLPATFFLIGDMDARNIARWRIVAKKGYELANHTLYHPCSSAEPDNPIASERYTPFSIVREISSMNNFLYAVDSKAATSYGYPCTETSVGGKNYVDTLRKAGFIKYARVGGDADAIITDFEKLDPLQVPSYGLAGGSTGEQLIAFVNKVEQSGRMGVFMFHGIGGDYIVTPADAHQQLLDYLKKNKKDIWVATFQDAMEYVEANKGKKS